MDGEGIGDAAGEGEGESDGIGDADRGNEDGACAQVRVGLAAYAFGALEACEWRVVTDHLAGCEACRSEHAGYVELAALMAAVHPWEHPDERRRPAG